jgi:hypothetical protein
MEWGVAVAFFVLAAAAVLFGRLFVAAFDVPLLRRFTPTNAAASAIVGTAVIVVTFGLLTMSGWTAPRIVVAIGAAAILMLLVAATRGRLGALRPRGALSGWSLLSIPMALAAVLTVLPLIAAGDMNVCNDTFIYSALSQWLQWNGLSAAYSGDAYSVMEGLPRFYGGSVRLSAAYLVAALQATLRAPLSLLVYPAAASWSVLLLLCAVALVLRWVFRLPMRWTAGALLAAALLPSSAYWAHHNGFFSQPLGLAALLFGIALASRAMAVPAQAPALAVVVGLLAAFLMTAYVPLMPLFGAAWLWTGAVMLWRGQKRRRLGRALVFCAAALVSFAAFGCRDGVALLRGLTLLATIKVGWHIPLAGFDKLAFMTGTLSLYSRVVPGMEGRAQLGAWIVATLFAALAAGGAVVAMRMPRARPLCVVGAMFAASLLYYSFGVRDPWTDEIGHTWSVFKLLQWMFPVLFVLGCAGAYSARRRVPHLALPLLAVAATLGLQHRLWLKPGWGSLDRIVQAPRHGARVATDTGRPSRLTQVRRMQEALRLLPEGALYLAGRSDDRAVWLGPYLALLAYPRPFLTDWDRTALGLHEETERQAEGRAAPPPRRVVLMACRPTENAAPVVQDLGWDCGVLAADRAVVVEVGGRRYLREGAGALRVMLWAPADTDGDLVVEVVSAGPSCPLAVMKEGQRVMQIAGWPAGERRVPLALRAGLTPVDLRKDGEGTAPVVSGAHYEPRVTERP